MQEEMVLALDFLDELPEAAVRTLELHNVTQVAAFLQQIPAAYSVQVMELSLPAFAAHLCPLLGEETAARLLMELPVSRMVAVLRHLKHGMVELILKDCPQSRRHACQLLMHFPMDRVGAWMVPNTAVVSLDFTVQEVLNFLKDATEETFSKYVFIVNRDGVPKGRISYLRLLKEDSELVVGKLMEPSVATISGHALLNQSQKLPYWDQGDVMPVIGTNQQFIGVLRHVDLRRGLQQLEPTLVKPQPGSDPVSGIIDVYGKSLLALFSSVSNVIEPENKS